jgi:hypothetical protein
MVHQSNTFFERCHGADYNPRVSARQREQCWARWLSYYTVGQPPERIEYANQRVTQIRTGEQMTPMPGIPTSALGTTYTGAILATSGDEVDAPPTPVPPPEADDLPPPPEADGSACANACTPRWYACMVECEAPAGPCRQACETEHRTCLNGCY